MPNVDVSLGNVYDLNKDFVKQLKPMTDMEIAAMYDKVTAWMKSKYSYYTLMCREKYDFTVFHCNWEYKTYTEKEMFDKTTKEIFDIAFSRGKIIEICQDERGTAYEFWLLIDDEVFLYLLFPYDAGVIEIY